MVRKGCNSLVRAEKILTHIAWVVSVNGAPY